MTDYIDLRTIDVIMKSFYNPNLLTEGYRFDKDGIFYSIEFDEEDPHASYLSYIDSLPLVASPGVFGMHENAKIAVLTRRHSVCSTSVCRCRLRTVGAVGLRALGKR